MLIVNFSKDSNKPFVNAILRVFGAMSLSFIFGNLLSKTFIKTPFPSDIPHFVILSFAYLFSFFIGGLILLTIYSSSSNSSKNNTFNNSLKLMPLPRLVRWIITISPGLIVILIINSFFTLFLRPVSTKLGVNLVLVMIVWTLGLVSSLGFALSNKLNNLLKIAIFIGINMLGYYVFDKSLKVETDNVRNWLLILNNILYSLPFISLLYIYVHPYANYKKLGSVIEIPIIPKILPSNSWFVVKLIRNKRTRSSILQTVTLVMLSSIYIITKHKHFDDPYNILLICGMFSAMIASEARGIMRRYMPPEMILIKGIKGIVTSQISTLIILNCIIGLPILFAVHGQVNTPFNFALFYFTIQIFCSLAGLFASTLFVPAQNEVGSQFFTVILATSSIYLIPKIGHFSNIKFGQQIPYWLTASVLVAGVIYIMEIIRRKNYGRS